MASRNLSSRARRRIALCVLCLPALGPSLGVAQQPAQQSGQSSQQPPSQQLASVLPDAPSALLEQQAAFADPQATASITGTVLDIRQALVPGARVALVAPGRPDRTTTAGADASFRFTALEPGRYRLTITAGGLEPFVSPEIPLHAAEQYQLPQVALAIAATSASVQVTASQVEIAQAQVHLEEKQRLLGVFPNFYSSYIWGAAPLNTRQKFDLAEHSIFDPVVFAATAAVAGIEQNRDTFPGYGLGAQGYAKRYFADYADEVSNRMFSSAIFPTLFHQDPRYFYKGTGSKTSRALYAISRTFVTRGDNGQQEVNYSRLLGGFASGTLSNAYHVGQDRGVGLTIRNASIGIGGNAADNLLREFVFKRFTKVPNYDNVNP
jgi:Carboxypeptidase regulatory-like domain